MGDITVTIDKDDVTNSISDILNNIEYKTYDMLDDVADIYQEEMVVNTPVKSGATAINTIVEADGMNRSIYSDVYWWEWLILGRGEIKPVNAKALWWPGLDHPVMKAKAFAGNDYPSVAFQNADPSVDNRCDQYLNEVVGD